LLEDFTILKAKNGEASGTKKHVTRDIARRWREMRRAIKLHDESKFFAIKINDKAPQRLLATKFGTFQLPVAKHLPQGLLC